MSRRKLNSDQNEEQSENQGRRSRSRTEPIACVKCDMVFFDNVSLVLHFECHLPVEISIPGSHPPIACIMCDMVFFDNVSLVLHFECHLPGKISIPGQHNGDLASSQSGGPLSLSLSPYSSPSVERTNEISPRVNNCFRSSPLPVSSAPTDTNFLVNSMPPINSSFDARFNVPQPTHRSAMSFYGSTSSSTHPLMYSQLGPRTFAYGPRPAPHLRLPEQYAGRARFRNSRIPPSNQPEDSVLIVLRDSDKEEAGGKNHAEEVDLAFKL